MRLEVEGFSCLQHAKLEVRPYTIIIGEQGSGKSLLLKLLYFLIEQTASLAPRIQKIGRLSALDYFKEEFHTRFPTKAWGGAPFKISFSVDNDDLISIARGVNKEIPKDDLEISLSKYFSQKIEDSSKKLSDLLDMLGSENEDLISFIADDFLKQHVFKTSFYANQLYIPSGRAFFSSLARVSAYLDPSINLDPITRRFAQIYLASLDTFKKENGGLFPQSKLMESIIGGALEHAEGSDFIRTKDGRQIDLSILSSGQQELLPLIVTLSREFVRKYPRVRVRGPAKRMLYVEEPEAHLFPEAQGQVIEDLISRRRLVDDDVYLLLSTHSPYVLTKVNNLLFAGEIGAKSDELKLKASKVVDERCWITRSDLSAYKIDNGRLVSIFDEESGLIDGEYLDGFSAKLSHEFYELMDLEERHS